MRRPWWGRLPLALAVVMGTTLGCMRGSGPGATTIAWDVSFDTPTRALATLRVELEVRRGTCDGALVWGPETLTRTGTTASMPPGAITAGPYCLRAVAIDGGCARFASAEATQELRPGGTGSVSLVLAPSDVVRECPPFACVSGTCMDALADAGMDTGPPDANLPDFGGILWDTGPLPDVGPSDDFPPSLVGCRERDAPTLGAIAAGAEHTCAITSVATYCWGADDEGRLGLGTVVGESRVPRMVTGGHAFTNISAGGAHTCALEMGALWCWGDNTHGQLGFTGPSTATPTLVAAGTSFIAVAAGRAHTCAVQSDGTRSQVWCWGANDGRQLGGPSPGADRASPAAVAALAALSPNQLAAGDDFTCATFVDPPDPTSTLWCWGAAGPWLGTATTESPHLFDFQPGFSFGLGAGARHACIVSYDPGPMSVHPSCWGEGTRGELGDGTATTAMDPVTFAAVGSSITGIALGDRWTCVVEPVDTSFVMRLVCAGDGATGITGLRGDDGPEPTPIQVLFPVSLVDGGARHVCASSGGSLVCWGDNTRGQLGTGAGASRDRAPRHVCF